MDATSRYEDGLEDEQRTYTNQGDVPWGQFVDDTSTEWPRRYSSHTKKPEQSNDKACRLKTQ